MSPCGCSGKIPVHGGEVAGVDYVRVGAGGLALVNYSGSDEIIVSGVVTKTLYPFSPVTPNRFMDKRDLPAIEGDKAFTWR
jgi:hypothetical protein